MTALAGYWTFAERPARLACTRMLEAQQSYGAKNAVWDTGPIALGRRLFETTPEEKFDRAPEILDDLVIAADVRLDNRAELLRDLAIPSGRTAGWPDSRILLFAYRAWGDGFVDRLLGDFAFLLWDGGRGRLMMARDFLGQRPLHYHQGSGFVAMASMPQGLHALAEIPKKVDASSVTDFLGLMPETDGRSFFEGVQRLLPGHFAIVTQSGVQLQRYWNPSPRPLLLRTPDDYTDAIREQLDRAVSARLNGCADVGSHLSGGLDSSAVAATAARHLAATGRVTAFTAVPREGYDGAIPTGRFGDERAHAAAVAALYPNMDHVLVGSGGRSPPSIATCNCSSGPSSIFATASGSTRFSTPANSARCASC